MKKIKPETFALVLKRANGLQRAQQIAKLRVNGSSPDNWSSLPVSDIFYPKSRRGASTLATKHLNKIYEFWKHVSSILEKMK